MTRRRRQIFGTVLGLLVVIGGLAGIKACQISRLIAYGDTMTKRGPPPEAVGSAIAEARSWPVRLEAVGTVSGVESVTVSNETAGIVTHTLFESGAAVRRGQPLIEIDSSVERAQLASAQARRDLARVNAERSHAMFDSHAIPRSDLDAADTALAAAESDVASLQAQIEHKIVRAPFDGRVGIRAVKVGQYAPVGTTITTVDSIGEVWVDFTLPQEQVSRVHAGTPVRVSLRGTPPEAGAITAIDPTVDPETRNLRLRATLHSRQTALRSGMFVTVSVELPARTNVVTVPATALVHAPYGDSIYVIEPKQPGSPGLATTPDGKPIKIARQQLVKLGEARGDFVAIREGLRAGQEVVAFGGFKLHNGSPIFVDNSVQPKVELEPHPENR
jgi:membrane fusion protein (multidrug efflux system)